jgi:hypothetical protein
LADRAEVHAALDAALDHGGPADEWAELALAAVQLGLALARFDNARAAYGRARRAGENS